jgi:hypothetical protein
MPMLRLLTDFQAIEPDGACWILLLDGVDIEKRARDLGLSKGDKVILDAEDGFRFIGILDFKFVVNKGREAWVAYIDPHSRTEYDLVT